MLSPPPPPTPPDAPERTPPTWTSALAFFGVLLALVLPDLLAQASSRLLGLAWSEVFAMLLPAVVATAGSNLRVARYLGLDRIRPLPILLGALVGAASFLAANGIMALWVLVLPGRILRSFPDVGRIFEGSPLSRVVVVTVASLLAPVCEETAFRGYLQRTLLRVVRPASAIGLTALLFAARHLDPVRFPALLALGAIFGWLAWRSSSLWPAVAAHAANNGLASALALTGGARTDAAPVPGVSDALTALLAGAVLVAVLALAYRRVVPPPPTGEAQAVSLRDDTDPSTRFRPELVPQPLLAAGAVGLASLLVLLLVPG